MSSNGYGEARHNGNGSTHHVQSSKRSLEGSDLSSDDDQPLVKKTKSSNGGSVKNGNDRASLSKDKASNGSKKRPSPKDDDESSDSDAPLGTVSVPMSAALLKIKAASKSASDSDDDDDDSDSDAPLTLSQSNGPGKNGRNGKSKETSYDDEDDEEEDDENDEDSDEEGGSPSNKKSGGQKIEHSGTGEVKWTTLYHTGPRFPPAYEPLPKSVKMKYDGKPVDLPPESEEAAFFYAVKIETQHARDAVFNGNFFDDWKKILKKNPPTNDIQIDKFEKCDFRPMYDHWRLIKEEEVAAKKMMAPSARKKQLENKKKAELQMKTCVVDGVEQKVGNVIVEPPALFLGRGEHPKKGRIKKRVPPEAITINHTLNDPKHPPPAPPPGHRWKEVKEDRTTTWLAFWIENINGQYKYMYLDATSKFKSNSDREKFEKARKLDRVVDELRRNIDEMIASKQRKDRQLGTVVWLIDNYSLRAGNEKGDDEAATYGVCSLLVEHVKALVDGRNQVKLEFLGKDSMRFKETLNVTDRIFKNFKMFTQSTRNAAGDVEVKKKTDEIFDKVDTSDVNKFLQNPANGGQKGLSAKVFRTYNASTTFQGLLNQTEENLKRQKLKATPQTLRDEYNQANRLVAILCNHQKSVNPVQSDKAAARFEERILAVKYDRFKERQKLLTAGTAKELKAQYPVKTYDWAKHWPVILEEVDISTEQVAEHEERMIAAKKERLQTSFDRAELERQYIEQTTKKEVKDEDEDTKPPSKKKSKKVKAEEEEEDDKKNVKKPMTQAQVDAEKKALDAELKTLQKERKSGVSEQGKSVNVASTAKKVLAKVAQMDKLLAEQATKEKTSDVALGTSKLNYIDPRITVSWLKKWDAKLVAQEGEPVKKSKVKKEEQEPEKKKKGAKDSVKTEKTNKTADSDKMELDLKIIPISHYFPMTMLKKFKWAAQEEDGSDLSPSWVFVKGAEGKIRDNMSSARRKGGAGGDSDESDDDDKTAVEKKDEAQAKTAVAAAKVKTAKVDKKRKADSDDDNSSDDDAPLARK
jgi:DNA topoisomerase-1